MTTLESVRLVLGYFKASWSRFSAHEKVLTAAPVVLAFLTVATVFWARNAFTVATVVIYALFLLAFGVLAALATMDRLAQHEMTADYLAQFDGEHTLTGPAGQTVRFDVQDGWVEARAELS